MDCVIYMRWSSAEQAKGSTLERQRNDCRAHAKAHGWNVVTELVDDGVSAFKGRHATAGSLGRFIAAAEAGEYPEGIVLLVEKLDRLSREEPGRVFVRMLGMAEAGVTIATVDGDRRYARGTFDMASIIEVVVKAQVSHEESAKKASRLSAAWAAKRGRLARGEGGVMTARAPSWLSIEGSPARFEVIEDRAAVVRRIYDETIAGFGKHHIARRLNLEAVPTFGRAAAWHASYVQKLLDSVAVLGDFQAGSKPRGEARTLVGEVVRGYFPPIVDAVTHARAQAARRDRRRAVGGQGRRIVNLFSGLAACGECGGKMTFRGKGARTRADGRIVREDYLVCDSHQRGTGCGNGAHFNYGFWEEAVLDAVLVDVVEDCIIRTPAATRALEVELAALQRIDGAERRKADAALELHVQTQRPEPRELWLRLVGEQTSREAELAELERRVAAARAVTPIDELMAQVAGMRMSLDADDDAVRFEARAAVASALHELIWPLRFSPPASCEMGVIGKRSVTLHADAGGIDGVVVIAPD